MKQLNQAEFEGAIGSGISVVDFFATRCGPCKMIAPYLEEMDEKTGDSVAFYKIDVDQERQLAASQDITAMPTLKIFKDGAVIQTIVGADLEGLWKGIQNALENDDMQQAA